MHDRYTLSCGKYNLIFSLQLIYLEQLKAVVVVYHWYNAVRLIVIHGVHTKVMENIVSI